MSLDPEQGIVPWSGATKASSNSMNWAQGAFWMGPLWSLFGPFSETMVQIDIFWPSTKPLAKNMKQYWRKKGNKKWFFSQKTNRGRKGCRSENSKLASLEVAPLVVGPPHLGKPWLVPPFEATRPASSTAWLQSFCFLTGPDLPKQPQKSFWTLESGVISNRRGKLGPR